MLLFQFACQMEEFQSKVTNSGQLLIIINQLCVVDSKAFRILHLSQRRRPESEITGCVSFGLELA